MANEITLQQYLAKEDLGLAVWGGKECLRLELLMDYSGPFRYPDAAPQVLGSAAVRWSVLSDEFGNGLRASNGDTLPFAQAILIAFLYAKIVMLDPQNRAELFQRVQDAIELCLASDDWSSVAFEPWSIVLDPDPALYLPMRQIVWPWEIAAWSDIEARRPDAFVELLPGRTIGTIKTYTATLLTGPEAPFAPQGWWLRFHQSDAELGRVLLPAAPLIAISNFMEEAKDGDSGSVLSSLLRRINLYYDSPERILFGAEAMAVRAAIQTILHPDGPHITDYRRQDDAIYRQDQDIVERIQVATLPSRGASDTSVSTRTDMGTNRGDALKPLMFCIYCGRPCEPADSLCGHCGKPVPPEIRASINGEDAQAVSTQDGTAEQKGGLPLSFAWVALIFVLVCLSLLAYFVTSTSPAAPPSTEIVAPRPSELGEVSPNEAPRVPVLRRRSSAEQFEQQKEAEQARVAAEVKPQANSEGTVVAQGSAPAVPPNGAATLADEVDVGSRIQFTGNISLTPVSLNLEFDSASTVSGTITVVGHNFASSLGIISPGEGNPFSVTRPVRGSRTPSGQLVVALPGGASLNGSYRGEIFSGDFYPDANYDQVNRRTFIFFVTK